MNLISIFKSLCLPSKVYLILSVIAILLTIISPAVFGEATVLMHIIHVVYALFWTWVLQLICRAGYKWISWVLVLAPFIITFLVALFVFTPMMDL